MKTRLHSCLPVVVEVGLFQVSEKVTLKQGLQHF